MWLNYIYYLNLLHFITAVVITFEDIPEKSPG